MFRSLPFDLSLMSCFLPAPMSVLGSVDVAAPNSQAAPFTHVSSPLSNSLATAFETLAKTTQERMRACHAVPVELPKLYAKRLSGNGRFTLQAQAWNLCANECSLAQMRFVKIDGGKSNIINAWVFPMQPSRLPVFAAELIGVGDVTRVAFVDLQTPALDGDVRQHIEQSTPQLARQFESLPCDEPAPDWATCQSSGHYTYARNASLEELPRICACYLAYLECYLTQFVFGKPLPSSKLDHQVALRQLHDYQMHHMEHSPGKKFLGNLFEPDWTDSFMREFLFATPRG